MKTTQSIIVANDKLKQREIYSADALCEHNGDKAQQHIVVLYGMNKNDTTTPTLEQGLPSAVGSVCRKCGDTLEIPYKVKCLTKFGRFPTLCADCFLDAVKDWALSDEEGTENREKSH